MIDPDGSPALWEPAAADTAVPLHSTGLHPADPGHPDAGASAIVA
ncbi:MAG: hypothetical protein OXG47_09100 [bacterium]|nr:hypothetical protein [bacterium]